MAGNRKCQTPTLEKKQKKNISWAPVIQATDESCGPNWFKWIALGRGHHRVWCSIHLRAIKECSKGINHDWVKNLACRMLHYILIIPNTFVTNYYVSKLTRKKRHTSNLFEFVYKVTIKIQVPIGLVVEVILTLHWILKPIHCAGDRSLKKPFLSYDTDKPVWEV